MIYNLWESSSNPREEEEREIVVEVINGLKIHGVKLHKQRVHLYDLQGRLADFRQLLAEKMDGLQPSQVMDQLMSHLEGSPTVLAVIGSFHCQIIIADEVHLASKLSHLFYSLETGERKRIKNEDDFAALITEEQPSAPTTTSAAS